ncbi:Hypothetical predicted protein [Pelobates cultripes]|uniref:Uncharacterized protein n=1 Tax=Pelobates cultripes TaxID=61616 RepID=A0AAD1SW91_PELCU|nr:Hypothetical predicted protein [Pelobates cultripes]
MGNFPLCRIVMDDADNSDASTNQIEGNSVMHSDTIFGAFDLGTYLSKEELTDTEYLDSIFGPSPPVSLLNPNRRFKKPPAPFKRYKSKRYNPLRFNEIFSTEQKSDKATKEKMKAENGSLRRKTHFLGIGGMLSLPVPVDGPLFISEDAK